MKHGMVKAVLVGAMVIAMVVGLCGSATALPIYMVQGRSAASTFLGEWWEGPEIIYTEIWDGGTAFNRYAMYFIRDYAPTAGNWTTTGGPYSPPPWWKPSMGFTGWAYTNYVAVLDWQKATYVSDKLYQFPPDADRYVLSSTEKEVTSLTTVRTNYFVPEPSSLLALASGLIGIGGVCWRKRR